MMMMLHQCNEIKYEKRLPIDQWSLACKPLNIAEKEKDSFASSSSSSPFFVFFYSISSKQDEEKSTTTHAHVSNTLFL